MCYSRAESGRNQVDVAAAGTSQLAIGPNPHRILLILCSHATVSVTYSFRNTAILSQGITLAPGQSPVQLSRQQMGSAICLPLSAITSAAAAGTFHNVIEITHMPGEQGDGG